MARPLKDGVDYFPKDTDFYGDDKVRLLRAEFQSKGMYLLDYLLCDLYGKNGYFIKWGKDKCYLVSDGAGCGCAPNFVEEFVNRCVACSFFDERVYNVFGVLTSSGIQRRYIRMFNSRPDIPMIKEYWLLDVNDKKDVPKGALDKLTFKSIKSTDNPDKSTDNPDKSTDNPQNKIEESKDIYMDEDTLREVAQSFEMTFGKTIGGLDRTIILELVQRYPKDLIIESIRVAKANNAASAKYIRSILLRLEEQGITTMSQYMASKQSKPTQRQRHAKGSMDYSDPSIYQGVKESEDIE